MVSLVQVSVLPMTEKKLRFSASRGFTYFIKLNVFSSGCTLYPAQQFSVRTSVALM